MGADVNYWLSLCVFGVVIVCGIFLYSAVRWRKAPRVFRAMNWVAAVSVFSGVLIALPLEHWLGPIFEPSSGGNAHSTWSRVKSAIEGTCPPAGVPATEVGKALVLADEQHAGDEDWNDTLFDACKDGVLKWTGPTCVQASLARHALGRDLKYGDHRSLIPCEEVAEFCDDGALDKNSALCKEAYRTRNAKLGLSR